MASSARHLFLFASAFLAIAVPRVDAWGGRLFFSKMTRPEAVEADNKASTTTTTVVPEAFDPNGPPAFSRPSSGSNRGYGLYGRPEESYPPAYFRRGVHRDAEKLTTTNNVPAPHEEATDPVEESSGEEGTAAEASFPEDGSGRGRPLSYARKQRQHYGMSDTRLYQNGRYYYDVDTDKYGYGHESNPVRTRPEENGSGYGHAGGGAVGGRRPGRFGNAAGYGYGNGNGNEFRNGVVEKQNGFEENQNEQYIP